MSHCHAWNQVILISEREDVVFFCSHAFADMATFHDVGSLEKIPENTSGFLICDFTLAVQPYIEKLPQVSDRLCSSICLVSTYVPEDLQSYLAAVFDFVIFFSTNESCAAKLRSALQIVTGNYEKKLRPLPLITEKVSFGPLFLGESEIMKLLRLKIKHVSLLDTNVLLLGETGTGKSTAASLIHKESRRCNGPFETVNLSVQVPGLVESSLFGTSKGTFTGSETFKGAFEKADGGVIFIDEVGIPEPGIQAKFLTVLENGLISKVGRAGTRKIDARAIFATNEDIRKKIKTGEFRKDFFYRISDDIIEFPPLRDHKEDIPLIAEGFLMTLKNIKNISENAMEKLMEYDWPGNVRDFQKCLGRAVNNCMTDTILPDDIDFGIFNSD